MGTDTTRKEMTLAVMEGICLAARQLAEVMCLTREEMDGLKVTGGGSKNEVWMQMLADVLGVRVQQMESTAGRDMELLWLRQEAGMVFPWNA